jgi:hypothetical protein
MTEKEAEVNAIQSALTQSLAGKIHNEEYVIKALMNSNDIVYDKKSKSLSWKAQDGKLLSFDEGVTNLLSSDKIEKKITVKSGSGVTGSNVGTAEDKEAKKAAIRKEWKSRGII